MTFQSFWLHVLGQEALEPEEEDSVAAGHDYWRSGRHCFDRYYSGAGNHHWHSCLGGQEGKCYYIF